MKASPDNLPARAAALIAGKDAEAIFRFVRDNIATYPSPSWIATGVRWGVRGTLRGGAGTPRDRAELLAWMYRQAGFSAEVAAGVPAGALAAANALKSVYARQVPRLFQPTAPPPPYASWADALGPSKITPKLLDESRMGMQGTGSGSSPSVALELAHLLVLRVRVDAFAPIVSRRDEPGRQFPGSRHEIDRHEQNQVGRGLDFFRLPDGPMGQ
jgi:hypothetical protein